MNVNRFVFGLAGFLIVAALIERYDQERGTNNLMWYAVIVVLGFAIAYRRPLISELQTLTRMSKEQPKPNTRPGQTKPGSGVLSTRPGTDAKPGGALSTRPASGR